MFHQHPNGNYIPKLNNGLILTMPQGGPIQYGSKLEAERHARLYENGYKAHAIPREIDDAV